jgi:hypothetical protein
MGKETSLKKLSILVFTASLLLLSLTACSTTGPKTTTVPVDQGFLLQAGGTAILKGEDISIKFVSVATDSRCPKGVTCIWAGEAKCNMRVTQNGQTRDVILTQSGSTESQMQGFAGNYGVTFSLSPYPESGHTINPAEYVLSIRLTK